MLYCFFIIYILADKFCLYPDWIFSFLLIWLTLSEGFYKINLWSSGTRFVLDYIPEDDILILFLISNAASSAITLVISFKN